MSDGAEPLRVAPAYATGGGGVVLEHRYGAVLLSTLITGDAVPELGRDVTPVSVLFQASAFSAVDDLVVVGRTADGGLRRVSIGLRRAPALTRSEEASAHLLASYVKVVTGHWDEVRDGRWRLALAVASPNNAVKQLKELAKFARHQGDPAEFRARLATAGFTDEAVRTRLDHIDDLVRDAAVEAGIASEELDPAEITWRILFSLRLRELRLEGVDETDWDNAVSSLRPVTRDKTLAAADSVFSRLTDLSDSYAPAGAEIAEWVLRRDLSGMPLDRSPVREKSWRTFDRLARQVREHTGFRIAARDASIELERVQALAELSGAMNRAWAEHQVLVVRGEPDVGKSALTLRAADRLAESGAVVISLSLDDLRAMGTVEFEGLLDGSLEEVLGASAVGTSRLLVVDGAEAVLGGAGELLGDLVAAALRVGLAAVVVSRDDAVPAVERVLQESVRAVGGSHAVLEHPVPALSAQEIGRLAGRFTALARLRQEPRAAWLLGRPGLVDLLLRAGAEAMLPDGPLDESQVFALLWGQAVRCGEIQVPGGPGPDERERALVCLARRDLGSGGVELPGVAALPSLRSDGLLRSAGPMAAWGRGDEFASDLIRDLALTRLLITRGWGELDAAEDPRRALRAARLACQACLNESGGDFQRAGASLNREFARLAERHGERWSEIPMEAMLTLGAARDALTQVWSELAAERYKGLRVLVRLALQRYARGGIGDAIVLAPLVELAFCGPDDPGRTDPYGSRSLRSEIQKLVLAWLRGLIVADTPPLALRRQVGEKILAGGRDEYDDFVVEAVALLGPDLDEKAEGFLTGLAEAGGHRLAPAVELDAAALALCRYRPQLLLKLAEAFYMPPLEALGGEGILARGGIRAHHKAGGFGSPLASWSYGPFYFLLRSHPAQALALINRMLDRAAGLQAAVYPAGFEAEAAPDPVSSVDLDLPGVGRRRCAGSAGMWSWYRGSSADATPCISALLAVEVIADDALTSGQPVAGVVAALLHDCHNLAMPGLVAGLLLRHRHAIGDLLDAWLACPAVWQMEVARVTGEQAGMHIQRTDAPGLTGTDQRRYSFWDLCGLLVGQAIEANDEARLGELAAIGVSLARAAHETAQHGSDAAARQVEVVERWATMLDAGNYQPVRTEQGLGIEYRDPLDRSARREELARGHEASRLLMFYGRADGRVAPVETLVADVALARDLVGQPPAAFYADPMAPSAAVAAAALVAHAHGRTEVPDDDLRWAAGLIIKLAVRVRGPEVDGVSGLDPMGVERSVAVGVAALHLPRCGHLAGDKRELRDALARCTTSGVDEVRVDFARAVAPVWTAPCTAQGTSCVHRMVWAAAQDGLGDCRFGAFGPGGQRLLEPLEGPYEASLPTVETTSLRVNRLAGPIVAAAAAARTESCVAHDAQRLLPVLLDAHRRGADYWARKGYGEQFDRPHRDVVRVLIEAAVAGDNGPLEGHTRALAANARGLGRLLRDAGVVFTYDSALRPSLLAVWRVMMATALEALESGEVDPDPHWTDAALGQLLPTPQLEISDTDLEATLERARSEWLDPAQIADLVARWIPLARREPESVDALSDLARCAGLVWQVTTGLAWMEELIDGGFSVIAGRCRGLTSWLHAVREAGLQGEARARWRRLVDGLAAAGDGGAAGLQRAEE